MQKLYDKTEKFYRAIGARPYWCAFLVCAALTPMCFGSYHNITDSARMIMELLYLAVPCAIVAYVFSKSEKPDRIGLAATLTGVLIAGFALCKLFNASKHQVIWIFAAIALPAVLLRAATWGDNENSDRHNAFMIMVLSFGIKICYVLYTSMYTRQNDVGSFDGESGHAGYIEYILTQRDLPDFDPRTRFQFYQPPLHHTVSAVWIYICEEVFGVSRNYSRESLQMLMLFYSVGALIVVYKLLRHFGFKGRSLILPLALFAFHPSFILSSGAINNDQLAALLTILAILLTMRWFDKPTTKNILKIALAIGFAMMSKLNSGTIAPAVAVMFLWIFIKNKDRYVSFLKQFCYFGVTVFPLALWWQFKNKIKYKMSLDYVPQVGEHAQYVGDDIFGRLTDFNGKQFSPVFENFVQYGDPYDEYNPNVTILKNSLFGERINATNFPGENTIVPTLLFWLGALLALLAAIMTIVLIFKKSTKLPIHAKVFFAGYWVFAMYYFYLFCYLFPNTCTQNFRYISPLLVVGVMQYATLFDLLEQGEQTTVRKICIRGLSAALIAFSVLSVATYLLVGWTS